MKRNEVSEITLYLWTLSFLRFHKWKVAVFIGCSMIATTIELLFPKVVQLFIDEILPEQRASDLVWLLGILVLLTGIMFGLSAARNILGRVISEHGSKSIQLAIFKQLRYLGFLSRTSSCR